MSTRLKRWFLGTCLLLVMAVGYVPTADAQVAVRVGPRYHQRYYRHHYYRSHYYYRHHHRYYYGR